MLFCWHCTHRSSPHEKQLPRWAVKPATQLLHESWALQETQLATLQLMQERALGPRLKPGAQVEQRLSWMHWIQLSKLQAMQLVPPVVGRNPVAQVAQVVVVEQLRHWGIVNWHSCPEALPSRASTMRIAKVALLTISESITF